MAAGSGAQRDDGPETEQGQHRGAALDQGPPIGQEISHLKFSPVEYLACCFLDRVGGWIISSNSWLNADHRPL